LKGGRLAASGCGRVGARTCGKTTRGIAGSEVAGTARVYLCAAPVQFECKNDGIA
jgi:hypothetical protein